MTREFMVFGIVSDSMRPTLRPGDGILVAPCAPRDLRAGDLVVVRRPGGPVCHRFLRRNGNRLVTQGDNAWRTDRPVPENALVGKVVSILSPEGGRTTGARDRWGGLVRILGRRLAWRIDRLVRTRTVSGAPGRGRTSPSRP